MKFKNLFILLVMCILLCQPVLAEKRLKAAMTTSIENTGLYYEIVEPFQEKTGIIIDGISVGTGKALELGRRGDVDLVIVHNRQAEDKFLADGYGVNRRDVMHNNFVILGPKNDPAGIKNAENVFDALKALNENQHPFISRGDNSGTHAKELKLWKKIKIKPEGKWYQEAGQGMGGVVQSQIRGFASNPPFPPVEGTFLSSEGRPPRRRPSANPGACRNRLRVCKTLVTNPRQPRATAPTGV